MKIKFGTSGWRAIVAEDFTFANAALAVEAIAQYITSQGNAERGVVIGRDTRFLGEDFTKLAAQVMATNGIPVYLTDRDVPTPVIAYEITRRKTAGGLNFTASHNPPQYQGIKFSTSDGAPALPDITEQIEKNFDKLYAAAEAKHYESFDSLLQQGQIEMINPQPTYLKRLGELVDGSVIKPSGLKVIYDCMHGTARDYTDKFLRDLGVEVETMHSNLDPYFGGRPPEPSEKNIPELLAEVARRGKSEFVIGIANDGDADRYAVIDSTGQYLQANELLAILFHYALKHKPQWSGCVVRTLATTHLIDAIAKKENVKLYDVPVGFKYIGEVMMRENMIVGGEESNGLSVFSHVPEKDGVLADLLFVEITARTKKPLSEYLQMLYETYGYYYTQRDNLRLDEATKNKLLDKVRNATPTRINGKKVVTVDKRDGVKMICENGSWLLVRFSGTEPVVRFYAEASTKAEVAEIIAAGKALI
jgi:phosphoglucomutase